MRRGGAGGSGEVRSGTAQRVALCPSERAETETEMSEAGAANRCGPVALTACTHTTNTPALPFLHLK